MSTLGNNLLAQYYAQQNSGYVRDGLVCWLDGIDNTRHGHDGTTTVWEDLSGHRHDWTIAEGTVVLPDCIQKLDSSTKFIASITTPAFLGYGISSGHTIECVVKFLNTDSGAFFSGNVTSRKGFMPFQNFMLLCGQGVGTVGFYYTHSTGMHSVTCVYSSPLVAYLDGVPRQIINATFISHINENAYIGGRSSGSNAYCAIYSLRVYDRELSTAEITHNHEIDSKRFNLP